MIRNFKHINESVNDKSFVAPFRKSVSGAWTTTGSWFDFSILSGIPSPNYYASEPMVARYISQSRNKGLYTGATGKKYLNESTILSTSAIQWFGIPFKICDFLLYYPFIDESTLGEQVFDNTESLTRYTDGEGVQMMAISVGPRGSFGTFRVKYTNQDGVSNRITRTMVFNNSGAPNGSIVSNPENVFTTGGSSPFLLLQDGDTGVRSVQSWEMLTPDTGLTTLVLVKPLASTACEQSSLPIHTKNHIYETGFIPVEIKEDAYINFLGLSQGAVNSTVMAGYLSFFTE